MTDPTIELDDIAARALASMILQRTADTLRDGGTHSARALTDLHDDTGLPFDVNAGILMATSWLAGTGMLDPVEVFAAAVALDPTETDDDNLSAIADQLDGAAIDPAASDDGSTGRDGPSGDELPEPHVGGTDG